MLKIVKKNNGFSQVIKGLFPVMLLIFTFLIYYVRMLSGNYDDLSVLRASAYLAENSSHPLQKTLLQDLELQKNWIGEKAYGRYISRLSNPSIYSLQNQFVLLFEKMPMISPYQSVFLANLFIHFITLTLLLIVLAKTPILTMREWVFCLLISLLPVCLVSPFSSVMHYLPFQREHVWYTTAPRGASLTALLAVFILWQTKNSFSMRSKLLLSLLLLILSFFSHPGGFLFAAIPLGVVWLVGKIGLYPFRKMTEHISSIKLVLVLVGGMIISGLAYALGMSLLFTLKPTDWSLNLPPFLWFISSLVLIVIWKKNKNDQNVLINSFMRFFLFIMPIFSGVNMMEITSDQVRWINPLSFRLIEATERVSGLLHVLFWMIVGGILLGYFKEKLLQNWQIPVMSLLLIVFIGSSVWSYRAWQLHGPLRDEIMLTTKISDLLVEKGVAAYDDEAVYFQSLANELKVDTSKK